MNKEQFKKKLKHGDRYCEKHDVIKESGPILHAEPEKRVWICTECRREDMTVEQNEEMDELLCKVLVEEMDKLMRKV